jgi:hypothetical protein
MQSVNSICVKTSLKRQLLAVVILTARSGRVRSPGVEPASETSRIDLQKVLASKKFVDLTYDFAPGIPVLIWFSRRTTQDDSLVRKAGRHDG